MRKSSTSEIRESHRTLRELVREKLLREIVTAEIPPGQALSDQELSVELGISRGPIREAMRELQGQGLVVLTPYKGAVVSRLTKAEVLEVYQMRVELEGLATRLATPKIPPDTIQDLRAHLEGMEGLLDDPYEWQHQTNAFHEKIYDCAQATRLATCIRELTNVTLAYSYLYLKAPGRTIHAHPDHGTILSALENRDAELAERVTREHLLDAARVIVDSVPEQLAPCG